MAGKPLPSKDNAAAATAAGDARFLHDIESLSKALSLDSKPRRRALPSSSASDPVPGRSRSNAVTKLSKSPSSKKNPSFPSSSSAASSSSSSSSFWKSLKALSHIGQRRFDCLFSLHVHSIKGIPAALEGAAFSVHWRRTSDPACIPAAATRSIQAFHGFVEFEETLTYPSSVYVRAGTNRSAKYDSRQFTIHASVAGAPGIDLGRHLVDLTRLLPLSVDEFEEEEKGLGKWSTIFRLSGRARGAKLNVSFGYSLVKGGGVGKPESRTTQGKTDLRQVQGRSRPRSAEDVKVLHEVLPSSNSDVSNDLGMLEADIKVEHGVLAQEGLVELKAFKLQEEEGSEESAESKHCMLSEPIKQHLENDCDGTEFNVIEQGIEITSKNQEPIDLQRVDDDEIGQEWEVSIKPDEPVKLSEEGSTTVADPATQDLDSVFRSLSIIESGEVESPKIDDNISKHPSYPDVKYSLNSRSWSLDAATELVACEFLSMLGIEDSPFGLSSDSDPESPRERLLKQFEKETLASGSDYFGLDGGEGTEEPDSGDVAEDFDLALMVHEAEKELQISDPLNSRSRAKLLADAETEALMHQWGFDEKAFQCSPPGSRSGFGSPIELPPPEELLKLPSLCEGLGPFVQTRDGGFLRSMNPALFRNAKNNGSLIMQASCPIVVPAEMGSGIMEILQHLASVGIEKLSMQASKLMPLEDITGKAMQQMAWDATPALESYERRDVLQSYISDELLETGYNSLRNKRKGKVLDLPLPSGVNVTSEYVSFDDLAPLAMEKIEMLSIEGLQIQSGMSDELAPYNINAQSIEGVAAVQLLDVKDNGGEVDGLMGLSITLDEWMKLDSGVINEENQISDRTSKILAAHHANSMDLITEGSKGDRKGQKSGRKWGLLGNNFTVALMVQLRNPLCNYEPVGMPMLALIQVERVFVPQKPRIYCTVSEKGNSEAEAGPEVEAKPMAKEEKNEEEDSVPQFKITEVHIAGLKTEPDKKKSWGSPVQQQSASRWLLATGMGKSNKHPAMKSKALGAAEQSGDTLWSVSSRARGAGTTKWSQSGGFNSHKRNPNVFLSK